MNTKEIEPKQGAATTADLSPQQQSQMKDVEQKPSAASSDEERLAADQDSLKRSRKDSLQKKSKTPTSQAKGVVESSGGVKRPHSDSSTPPLGKQQPTKPRNT
jgi:hypothetical protein